MAVMTELEFSRIINAIARENRCGTMEAILKYCNENFVEPDDIKSLITGPLKDKLRAEFEEINMLQKRPKFNI